MITATTSTFFVSPRYRCPACSARLWVEDITPGEPGWRCRGCGEDQTEHVLSVAPKRSLTEANHQEERETMPDLTTITMTNGASAPSPTPARPQPMNWDDLAAARLAELLVQIRQVDAWRREATRIHAALLAYGRVVDSLPWSEAGEPLRTTRPARACEQCGRAFYPTASKARFCSVRCASLYTAARLRQQRAGAPEAAE